MIEVLKLLLIKNSGIPKRYLNPIKIVPEKCDELSFITLKEISSRIEEFVNDGHNLLIYSENVGNGKTTSACKLGLTYIKKYSSDYNIEAPVIFVNAAEYINKRKSAIENRDVLTEINLLEKRLYEADLVIWDDVATKALSAYDMELLYVFINNRISNLKSNIFTSNANVFEMTRLMGPRLSSRIVNNSVSVTLNGQDHRKDMFNFGTGSSN